MTRSGNPARAVSLYEEVHCPRAGSPRRWYILMRKCIVQDQADHPSRAVTPCEVVHFPDQAIRRGSCEYLL